MILWVSELVDVCWVVHDSLVQVMFLLRHVLVSVHLIVILLPGWGGPGGYVYQKAYLEFFCSPKKLNALVDRCKDDFPSLTYMAVNKDGSSWISNIEKIDVNAVTWGVFPAKEIIQPTVVDPASFMVWKDEAFEIWSRGWARHYPEADPSRKLLEEVYVHYSIPCLNPK